MSPGGVMGAIRPSDSSPTESRPFSRPDGYGFLT